MNTYFFILGRNPALSLAEITSYFNQNNQVFRIRIFCPQFIILETDGPIQLDFAKKRLGGVIKAGEITGEMTATGEIYNSIKDYLTISKLESDFNLASDKKMYFGFSLYLYPETGYYAQKRKIEAYFLELKKSLRAKGRKIRLVTSREKTLSSVVVEKNKLTKEGAEICIFCAEGRIFFGKTSVVQDFEGFNFRDYSRPARDMQIGLIPPKLGRIMINLSGAKKEGTILDPFCGCGTIVQEALVLGYKNLYASDLNMIAVMNTKKNIAWLINNLKIETKDLNLKILHFDMRKAGENLAPKTIDRVITEPYLGPPVTLKLSEAYVIRILENVKNLYLDFFRSIREILKDDGKIVIVFPVFRVDKTLKFLSILNEVENLGYESQSLLPEEYKNLDLADFTERGSIVYSRSDQNVLREIFIFKKKTDVQAPHT